MGFGLFSPLPWREGTIRGGGNISHCEERRRMRSDEATLMARCFNHKAKALLCVLCDSVVKKDLGHWTITIGQPNN